MSNENNNEEQLSFRQRQFLRAFFRSLGDVSKAARAAGIPRRTYYNWIKDNLVFKLAVEEVKEENIDFAIGKLFELMEKGNAKATIYYLKTHGKSRGYG